MSRPLVQRAQESGSVSDLMGEREEPEPSEGPTSEELQSWAPPALPRPWKALHPLPKWSPQVLATIVVAAVLADLAFRLPAASLAASLAVFALVAVLGVAGRLNSLAQRCGAVLIVSAGALLTVRASDWVVSMLLAAIFVLLGLVAADGLVLGQRKPWARSISAGFAGICDVSPWLYNGAAQREVRFGGPLGTWLRSMFAAGLVVFVLGALLASADPAFDWLVGLFDLASWIGHLFVALVLMVPIAALAITAARARPEPLEPAEVEPRYRVESLTVLWGVALLLAVWCGLQVALVSGGVQAVVLTEQGLTAAEYTRDGFFQLVTVAVFCLTVLNVAHRTGRSALVPDSAQRLPTIVVGFALMVLVLVSFSRLAYYVGAFGMTMLRLSVATFLGWLAIMTLLSAARSFGVNHERNWLPSAAVLSAALFAVLFGVANPERWVAQINLERATIDQPVDTFYLVTELGPDAKPAVADYAWARLGGMPDDVAHWLCDDESVASYGPLGWNSSRNAEPSITCP